MGLFEKMEYIGGVLPRKMLRSIRTETATNTTRSVKIASVHGGKGALLSVSFNVNNVNWGSYGMMTCVMDGEEKAVIGDTRVRYQTNVNTTLSTDLNALATPFVNFPIKLNTGSSEVVNYPLFFEHDMEVNANLHSDHDAVTVTALVVYCTFT